MEIDSILKVKICLIAHFHVVSNTSDFVSSVIHKRRNAIQQMGSLKGSTRMQMHNKSGPFNLCAIFQIF